MTNIATNNPVPKPTLSVPQLTAELQNLLKRAQSNDLDCLAELRETLKNRPELWQEIGDLGAHAELSTLRLIANNDLYFQEAIKKKLAELKAELAGTSPTPVEKLVIDRIGVCWLQVHQLDLQATSSFAATPSPTGLAAQRRIDSAHRRYLLAIKQLVTVRKLLRPDLPAIQIGAFMAATGSCPITLTKEPLTASTDTEDD